MTLSGEITGTGDITVGENGSLQIGSGTAGSLSKNVVNNGSVTFNRSNALFRSNAISGSGSLTVAGAGVLTLAGDNSYTGGTTLTAGTLSLAHANAVGTTGAVTMNGGTLQFTPANRSDLSSRLTLADGKTAIFDTNSRSVTFATALTTGTTGTAALTKVGAGTLTLAGVNTFTGITTVSAGVLNLTGSLVSPVTVASGGTLTGSGSISGGLTLSTGSILLASPTQHISAAGVTASGVTVLPDAASITSGTNLVNLISYGSGPAPAPGDFSTAGFRNPFTLDDTGSSTILFQFDTAARTWAGTTGTWDTGTSATWANGDLAFFQGDAATFGDLAADNIVTLTGTLAPASVAVTNNTAFAYTFSGTGSIAGSTSLTKSGVGALTISTANTFTGGTTLNGGTLTATAAGALGTGPISITTGTLAVDGGTLTNTINGTGDILATGTGQGTLSGNLSGLAGSATVSTTGAGKLAVTGAALLPATLPVNVSSGSTFYGAGSALIAGAVTLNGAGNTEALGALRLDTGATVSGSVILAGASTSVGSNSGTGRVTGIIGETGGSRALTKLGGGIVALSGTNTYTGATILSGGTLQIDSAAALASTASVNLGALAGTTGIGSTLDITNTNTVIPALISNANVTSTTGTHFIKGTGTLTVNGASDLILQNPSSSTLGQGATVDMSGLANFVYDRSSNNVSIGGASNQRSMTLHLPNSSTFTAANFNIQDASYGAGNTTSKIITVTLGANTVINANTVNTQTNACDNTTLRFRNVPLPKLTIRATDGTSRANWSVGSRTANTSSSHTALVDLTSNVNGASTLDALIGTLAIGTQTNAGTLGATFQMGRGTLDATSATVGSMTGSGALTATLSISGGTAKIGTLTQGNHASGTGTLSSLINLNAGGTIAAQTIQNGTGTATRTFTWNSGTITTLDATSDLTVSTNLTLAATGSHVFDIGTGRLGTVSGIIGEAAAGGALTKSGSGTLILSGANTYTGDTLVTGGTLTLPNAVLADGADVRISNGAILNLTHSATDTVDELYIDGVQQAPGTWGSLTSSATHKTSRITGSGLLQVTTGSAGGYDAWATANAGGQTPDGDYDNDGVKNGVEYFFGATGSSFTPSPAAINGTITWPKDATAAATPIVEASTDLTTWTPVTFVDNGTSIQYTIPTGDPKRFVRLRVTVP
ncbi:MAG: autotransporter-associated beta strand repeat-containing protein [Luteolibacter sp.]